MKSRTKKYSSEISLKEWIITILIIPIPVVGLVMLFLWGFGANENPVKANFAKITLIIILILLVAYLLYMATVGFLIFGKLFS
jgi:hypothetical protein